MDCRSRPEGILRADGTRRHPLPRAGRVPLQLQQSARRLPGLRRSRQDHRHQRGPRHPGQDEDHLRRSHRLLARREDGLVQGPSRRGGAEIRHSRLRALVPDSAGQARPHLERPQHRRGRQLPHRHQRILRLGREQPLQDPVQIHAQPLQRPDGLPQLRRLPPAPGGTLCQGRRQDHPRVAGDERRRAALLPRPPRTDAL